MKQRLAEILICPVCGHKPLNLAASTEAEGQDEEVQTGLLSCPGCGRECPVVRGIPRLLPPHLMADLVSGLEGVPEFRCEPVREGPVLSTAEQNAIRETLHGYAYHHIELQDPSPQYERWRKHFADHSPMPPEYYRDKLVLDLGCGEGRHAFCAAEQGARVVGVDLSRSVELAAERSAAFPEASFVQADVYHLPFRPGAFDVAYSIGVLHHTPRPLDSFMAMRRLVRPGGLVSAWVYGLQQMSWLYRLSHMTWLRPLVRLLPSPLQRVCSLVIAAVLDVLLWTPCRILALAPALRRRIESTGILNSYRRPFISKWRAVYDRFQPPVTHYLNREDLESWMEQAGLERGEVHSVEGRGWLFWGWVPGS